MQNQTNPLLADFRNFLYMVWKHLRLPDPTPVQYEIADFLQSPLKRKGIEAFRGVGKSWITSTYVLWKLKRDPEAKFLIVSASKIRADDFSTFTLRLIKDIQFLNNLIPDPKKGHRESKISFDVGPSRPAHAPSVKSVGIYGQLSGSRATDIIADDVEVTNNAATQDMREKLVHAVAEFEAILVPDQPDVGITFLGTPQTEESIYNKLPGKGYEFRIWPARYPSIDEIGKYHGRLAPSIQEAVERDHELIGQPTDPRRFNEQELQERAASYGRSGFALQFMLDTSLSDAERYPLKTSDLVVFDCHREKGPVSIQYGSGKDQLIDDLPNIGFTGDRWYRPLFFDNQNWTPYEGMTMSIDPSGRGGDETGYAVCAQLHGNLFLLDAGGLLGGYDDTVLKRLAMVAKAWSVNRIVIESNFGDGMFLKLFTPVLSRIHPTTCEEVRSNKQKELRIIDTLEPVMNQHRLILNKAIIDRDLKVVSEKPHYSLFYQMTRITKDRGALKHDDRLDAVEIVVRDWLDALARDEQRAAKDWADKALDKELQTFMDGLILGHKKPKSQTFNSIGISGR